MFNLFHPLMHTGMPSIGGVVSVLANTVNNVIVEATNSTIEEIRESLESKGLLTAEVDAVLVEAITRGPAKHHQVVVPGVPKARSVVSASDTAVSVDKNESVKVRKPRKPTPYNIYIQSKIAELKANNIKGLVGKEFMKAAIEMWNADKASEQPESSSSTEEPVKKRRGRPPKNVAASTAAVVKA